MERSCTFRATDVVSVCAAARGWTGSPSASPSSRASAAAGGWNPGALRCFHPVNNYSPPPGTRSNKRSTTIRPRQASSWSWCCPAVLSGLPSVSGLELQSPIQMVKKSVRNDKSVQVHSLFLTAADQKREKTRESSHLVYFLRRNAQNSVGPAFISDPRCALCCLGMKCTMWNFILCAPVSRSKCATCYEVHQQMNNKPSERSHYT